MVNDQKRVLWEGECKFEMLKVNEKGPNKQKKTCIESAAESVR